MVDVAQLVSASDCGSEGRGFDSHHPPHKTGDIFGYLLFLYGIWWMVGVERPVRPKGGQKHAGGMFLGRGRLPSSTP